MPSTSISPIASNIFDDDGEDGWQEMPVVREDEFASGLDKEDQKKYHYVASASKSANIANATGNLIDVDDRGNEWRSKLDSLNESDYTRLRVNEEEDADEVHLRTRYLFDEDKAMTPLSQMQATKNLLTEAQRIAYVGLCALTSGEMAKDLKVSRRKELKAAGQSMELWAMKIMGRLYYHMELETQEQKMIESLAMHGVQAMDLVPALMTTHTVANPEYDPAEARRQDVEKETESLCSDATTQMEEPDHPDDHSDATSDETAVGPTLVPPPSTVPSTPSAAQVNFPVTARVLAEPAQPAMPGVTTSLSAADENVTLDIRWTVLCDLFLILIADSVYDARSRVLLENVALKLGLGWLDVVKFECRVTEALEIQEGVEKMEHQELIEGRQKAARKKRYMMMGLATLGGGLVIGLSAGLLAPVIGAGLGAAFTTIGITGTTGFLGGVGGAAVITTGGVLTGSGIAGRGMANRTQQVKTFDVLPLHNNKRVNCILTVPGFMNGSQDDVRLPFSVLDPIVGDVFSVLWEPEMIRETGSALKILTSEVLSQLGQTVLQATVMTALMSALQWPIILTKLGYLIDNPWNNALDRAKAAGNVLADVLIHRHLGVRPITVIGFSLGARVIFYALLELAKHKAYGIVQDVFLLGATLTASQKAWFEARSVVSGRFVNAYAKNDWVLNYLFRATSGGLNTVAGLRAIEGVPGLENVDVTDKISGHMSYRAFMPLILDQLGFPVSADYFDEPEEPDFTEDRIVVQDEEDLPKKKGWFSRKKKSAPSLRSASRPPRPSNSSSSASRSSTTSSPDVELPPQTEKTNVAASPDKELSPCTDDPAGPPQLLPSRAGFDFNAIKEVLGKAELNPEELQVQTPTSFTSPPIHTPTLRSESAPHPLPDSPKTPLAVRSPLNSVPVESEAGTNPPPNITSSFSRSLSLNNIQDGPEPSTSFADLPKEAAVQRLPSPTLTSSSGRDGSHWTSGKGKDAQYSPYSSRANSDPSTETFSFGNGTGSVTESPYAASAIHNPFAAFNPSASSASLSFGGADGSITNPSTENFGDPWATPNDTKKARVSTLNLNPWSG